MTYDNSNTFVLFPTNVRTERAPSHNGFIQLSRECIEQDPETGLYKILLTAWMREDGTISGKCKSISEREDEIAAYKTAQRAKQEAAKPTPAKAAKPTPVKKPIVTDDIPF